METHQAVWRKLEAEPGKNMLNIGEEARVSDNQGLLC